MKYGAKITGVGLGVPSKVVTNDDLSKIVDTNDEWIRTRTGIERRHFVDRSIGETITDVCVRAANEAMDQAGVKREEIEVLLSCTLSPQTFMPNSACRLIDALGLKNAGGFDVNGACSGYIMGIHTVRGLINSGMHKKVLLLGSEMLSAAIDMTDRSTCVLFGDGAGAAVVERVENPISTDSQILSSRIYTQFDKDLSLSILGGASEFPSHDSRCISEKLGYVKMNGQEVFKAAVKGMIQAANDVLSDAGFTTKDLAWFVPHQANLRIIEMVAKLLDFPMEKTYVNIQDWANTSSATTAICLAEMNRKGLLKKGDLILIDVFGGGFGYGAALIRW